MPILQDKTINDRGSGMNQNLLWPLGSHDFQPGDGSRYFIQLFQSENGGIFVINHEESMWRYHKGDQLKFLIGNNNKYTHKAIWEFLEALK